MAGATVTMTIPPNSTLSADDKTALALALSKHLNPNLPIGDPGTAVADCMFEINTHNEFWPGLTVSCRSRTVADPAGD